MTDRELLELAAKAAGLQIDKSETNGGGAGNTGFDCMGNVVLDWHNNKRWNPLIDDGDALRLAVKLEIDIEYKRDYIKACNYYANVYVAEKYNYDRLTATRRAIVLAAAEIGRNM